MAQFAIDEILTTGIAISGFVFDVSNNIGANGYVLTSTSSGVMWQQDSSNADLSSLSGQIAATGTLLNNRINSLSGYVNGTFVSGSGVANYVARWSNTKELLTGSIYDLGTGIGIGTTSPAAKLEVKGADDAVITAILQSFAGGNAGYNGGIQLGNAVANQNSQIYHSSAGDNTLTFVSNYAGGTANKFIFAPGGTETVRFQQNGRVGIGFQTPTESLDVSGRIRAIGEAFTLNAATLTNSQTTIALSRLGAVTDQKYWEIISFNAAANGDFAIRTINDAYSASADGLKIVRGSSYNIASVLFPNGKVGIGTASPTTLLSVGSLGSTTAASGITFGGDASANLFRDSNASIATDGAFYAAGRIRSADYIQFNSNLYSNAFTNPIDINVGNSAGNAWLSAIRFNQGGYVGIGTNQPSGKFHIVSSVAGETVLRADGTNGTLFSVTDDLSDSLMSVNNSAGLPVFEVFADDRIVGGQYGSGDFVLKNNKIGIGVLNPGEKLDVNGNVRIGLTTTNVIGTSNTFSLQTRAINIQPNSSTDTLYIRYLSDGNYQLQTATAGANGGNLHLQPYGGDVGIGITQPGGRLHISGSNGHVLYLNQGVTGAQGGLYLQNVDQFALSSARLYFISGDSILFTRGASNLAWAVSQNANVGIGVSNPSEKLTITGAVKILTRDGANFKVGDGSNNNTFLEFDYPDITTSNAYFRIFRNTNTVGGKYFQIFKGDGTATSQTLLNANGDSHINAIAGNLGIGTDSPNHLLNLSTVTSDTSIGLYTTTSNTSARNWLISANDLAYGDFSLRQSLAKDGNPRISGVSRFYITNNGNVGVGTVNPSYNLDVIGTVRASGELISEGNNARISLFRLGGINYFDWASGQSLYFSTESSVGGGGRNTVMSITSGGNVGVGTVNAVAPIHIGGNASNNDPWMVLDINDTYFKRIIFSEERSAYGTTGYGGYIGYDADNNVVSLGVYENSTQNRVLNIRRENGNVGIGTTNPNTLLNVHGANPFVRINNTGTNDQGIKISYNNSDTHGLHLLYNASSAVSYIDNTYPVLSTFVYGDIYFRQNVAGTMTTRMTIKADGGNVGIGTTSPVGKLTVQGNIEVNYNSTTADSFVRRSFLTPHAAINRGSNIAFGIVDGGGLAGMTVYNTASSVAGYNSQFIGFNTHEGNVSTDERMRITQSGYVGIGTFAPLTLLSVGTEGSTSAVNGLTFGGDAQVNLYRSAENVLKTDGSLIITDSLGLGISPTQKLQVDGVVGNPALNGTTQSGIFRISNTTDNAVLDFGIRAGGLGAWIQSTDETSLSATYPLLLNPNGGSVGIGITNPSGQLHLRNMGFTNQATVPDTNLFPNASGVFGLVMDHDTYTNGLYRHRFIKVDRSANIPLYLQQAGSVAHQYINLVRFGTHSQSTDTFEVFGDSRINGSVNVTSTLSTSGSINIGADLYVADELGVGVPIANKRFNYGAEIEANSASIQLVLGRLGNTTGQGGIGADASNTFAVWNVSGGITKQFVITQQGNVGIGSETPTQKLDVNGTLKIKSAGTYSDPTDNAGFLNYDTVGGIFTLSARSNAGNTYMAFRTSNGGTGSEKVRITNNGLVGISSNAPTDFLDFGGAGKNIVFGYAAYGEVLNSAASIIGNNVKASPTANSQVRRFASANDQGNFIKLIYNKGVTFHTNITSALNTDISEDTNERMRINLSGDVGIGTLSPSGRLSVDFAGISAFNVCDSLSSNVRVTIGTINNAGTTYGLMQTYQHNTDVAGVSPLAIQPLGGNVGIGITNSPALFHVFSLAGRYINFTPASLSGLLIQRNQNIGSQGTTVLTLVNAQGTESLVDRGTSLNLDIGYGGTSTTTAGTIARGARIAALNHNTYSSTAADQNAYLAFYTATGGSLTEKVRIQADGKVGIGISSPITLLSVGGAGSTSAASGLTFGGDSVVNLYRLSDSVLKTDAGFTAASLSSSSYVYAATYLQTAGGQLYAGAPYGTLTVYVGNVAQNAWEAGLYVGRGSYVGIGTTQPSGKLHVVSTVAGETVLRADGTNGTLFSVVDDLSDSLMSVNNSAGLPVLEVFADDRVVAGQYGSGDFVIVNNKVGIGTSNPSYRLDVRGSGVNSRVGLMEFGTWPLDTTYIYLQNNSLSLIGANYGFLQSPAGETFVNAAAGQTLHFRIGNVEKWAVTSAGILQSDGAQTIRTSTGPLTLATNAGDGHIILSPNGAGNVGIGTTNPAALLDLYSSASRIKFRRGSSYDMSFGMHDSTFSALSIKNASDASTIAYFQYDGKVGIGTTVPTGSLNIVGANSNGLLNLYATSFPGNVLRLNSNFVGGNYVDLNPFISSVSNGGFEINLNGTRRLVIEQNGSVGIGTTNPSIYNASIIAATGNSWFQSGLGVFACVGIGEDFPNITATSLMLGPSNTRTSQIGKYAAGIGFNNLLNYSTPGNMTYAQSPHAWIGLRTDTFPGYETCALAFATRLATDGSANSTVERMCLTPSGNVGIGTTNPSSKLEVYSATKTSTFVGLSISNYNDYDGTAASLVKSQLRFAILENPPSAYSASNRTFATCEAGNEANNSSSNGFFSISTRTNAVVTEKFRITSVGNVGVGVTNPVALLSIGGTGSTLPASGLAFGQDAQANIYRSAEDTIKTDGSLIVNGNFNTNSTTVTNLNINAGTLNGIPAGSTITGFTYAVNNGNVSQLNLVETRFATGSDWTTASTKIQKRVDVTNQAYIEFNPSGSAYGMAFGVGFGATEAMRIASNGTIGIGITSTSYKLQVLGSFAATTKSFDISHPTISGKRLTYASLEGPENGVYFRGKNNNNEIDLPHYWSGLVHDDSITVNLTSIGKRKDGRIRNYSVDQIGHNKVYIYTDSDDNIYDYYYTIFAERKDVSKLVIERDME